MVFARVETPLAYTTLFFTVLVLVWKTCGLLWLPVIGPAFHDIFDSKDHGTLIPKYPRRSSIGDDDDSDDDLWNTIYLFMYGVLGFAAQYGGLQLSIRRNIRSRDTALLCTRLYGFFHAIISIHHFTWSIKQRTDNYGKLEMWRYNLPGVYLSTSVVSVWMLCHALQLITAKKTTPLIEIRHRKATMDCITFVTFISVLVFFVANIAGIPISFEMERFFWALSFYPLPLVLVLGAVTQPQSNTNSGSRSE